MSADRLVAPDRCETYGCWLPGGHTGYCIIDFATIEVDPADDEDGS